PRPRRAELQPRQRRLDGAQRRDPGGQGGGGIGPHHGAPARRDPGMRPASPPRRGRAARLRAARRGVAGDGEECGRYRARAGAGRRDMTARVPSSRGPVLLGLVALALLLGGFGLWSATSQIAGAVVAGGQVEVEQNRQAGQHPGGGVVEEVLVKDGDLVAAGAPLLRLDGALLRSELAIVEGQFFEILARRGRLEAERDDAASVTFPEELARFAEGRPEIAALMAGQERLFAARAETEANEIDQLRRRSAQIASQIAGIAAQREIGR